MRPVFVTILLALAAHSAQASDCRTVRLNPPPRIFNAPAWDLSGERILVVDIAAGRIDAYSLSGMRERSVMRPGPDVLDFSRPNSIEPTETGYVLGDGPYRFVVLDRTLRPAAAHDIESDRREGGEWRAAPFQWVPFDGGIVGYGFVQDGRQTKTGIYRIHWGPPLRVEFLRKMPGNEGLQPYLLGRGYLARLGKRVYAFSFEPDYGLIEIEGARLRLLKGLPPGFGSVPQLPPNQGPASTPALYAAFARAKTVVKVVPAGGRLYLLMRDFQSGGARRWFLAEYDPAQEKTVSLILLPTSADQVEVTAGTSWLAIVEKGPFLPDERFTPGSTILVPMATFGRLHGGTIENPLVLCKP